MSGFLDTSILVRYLTGDPPELAERASQVIDQQVSLLVCDMVLAETAYVNGRDRSKQLFNIFP